MIHLAALLRFLIIYIFGILFTDTAVNNIIEHSEMGEKITVEDMNTLETLDIFFGSLYRSMVTLFQTISNGVAWNEPANALTSIGDVGYFWVQLYHFYIAFCRLAVRLNVLVAGVRLDLSHQ